MLLYFARHPLEGNTQILVEWSTAIRTISHAQLQGTTPHLAANLVAIGRFFHTRWALGRRTADAIPLIRSSQKRLELTLILDKHWTERYITSPYFTVKRGTVDIRSYGISVQQMRVIAQFPKRRYATQVLWRIGVSQANHDCTRSD